jgi:hypothetical protein
VDECEEKRERRTRQANATRRPRERERESEREKENKLNGKNTYTSHTSRSISTMMITPS